MGRPVTISSRGLAWRGVRSGRNFVLSQAALTSASVHRGTASPLAAEKTPIHPQGPFSAKPWPSSAVGTLASDKGLLC